jgi:hypothetical protein
MSSKKMLLLPRRHRHHGSGSVAIDISGLLANALSNRTTIST